VVVGSGSTGPNRPRRRTTRRGQSSAGRLGRDPREEGGAGKPPTYYAVLMLDADRMSEWFNAATNADHYRKISETLARFAVKTVGDIVEKRHHGQLIYAGGDDVLCLLPTETALACAGAVNESFCQNWLTTFWPDRATLSGGLVVTHYKEDLRFVLERARDAEKAAKAAGRDALVVTVCRRSGEHTSALVPWDFLPTVDGWVNGFLNKASDRWAYRLRADLPTFTPTAGTDADTCVKMFRLEVGRQLGRGGGDHPPAFPGRHGSGTTRPIPRLGARREAPAGGGRSRRPTRTS